MGSFTIKPGMKLELTDEQRAELEALKDIKDEDIDLSDIPEITKEEFKKFFKINPRTPEEWERYYKNCPLHVQKRHEQQRKLYGRAII